MSNMFSGKVSKKVPQTLSECVKPDPTASNLHIWAERLESWGKTLFILLIIIGAITSVVLGVVAADAAHYSDEILAFLSAFFASALAWALIAFVEYLTYHVFALLTSALASIVQNTIISANVALLTASQEFSCEDSSEELPEETLVSTAANPTDCWICKSCGQHNKKTASFCVACGKDF